MAGGREFQSWGADNYIELLFLVTVKLTDNWIINVCNSSLSTECRVSKSASYGRLPSLQGRGSPRAGGMSRRSKSPSSTSSGTCLCPDTEEWVSRTYHFFLKKKNIYVWIWTVSTANGTAGSQLSTPRSGKSPSPSPTSPASLRRRRVTKWLFSMLTPGGSDVLNQSIWFFIMLYQQFGNCPTCHHVFRET